MLDFSNYIRNQDYFYIYESQKKNAGPYLYI